MSLHEHEFRVLRQTIASRGTLRMALVPPVIAAWAVVASGLLLYNARPIASLFSLAILIAGFEAVHALHVGVERIGRYLQVFYEGLPDGPRWETTAMRLGPGLPGGSIDPLFTVLFVTATLANLFVLFVRRPDGQTLLAALVHVGVIVRLVRCRRAAAGQRTADLQTFEAVRTRSSAPLPRSTD